MGLCSISNYMNQASGDGTVYIRRQTSSPFCHEMAINCSTMEILWYFAMHFASAFTIRSHFVVCRHATAKAHPEPVGNGQLISVPSETSSDGQAPSGSIRHEAADKRHADEAAVRDHAAAELRQQWDELLSQGSSCRYHSAPPPPRPLHPITFPPFPHNPAFLQCHRWDV